MKHDVMIRQLEPVRQGDRDVPVRITVVKSSSHQVGLAHATIPKSDPTPAVSAMANAPQNVTRIAPNITSAPPARAANPPRSARNTSEVPETRGIKPAAGAMAVTTRGMAAPTAKLPADASAA